MIDALTNVSSFHAYEQRILTCKSPKLFLVDIKAFKTINLQYGDEAGDAILRSFSKHLSHFAQSHEMELFRLKNDQFILLLDAPFELSSMEKLIFTLCDVLKTQTYTYNDASIEVDVHMGISFDHFHPLEKAQKALLVAKAEDQLFVTYSEFANTLASESEEKIELLIKESLANEKLVLHFQGVVDRNQHTIYYESLIRMGCGHGLQSPKLFLKIAKERHVYDLILETIAPKIVALSKTLDLPIALNLSSEDFLEPSRIDFLCNTFAHTSTIFEIQCDDTAHIPMLHGLFARFKSLGIRIALDNVEHASLVEAFDSGVVDYVKIHGDIVRNLSLDERAHLKCRAILETTHHKQAKSIATHLNAKGALSAAQTLSFDLFQGYIFELPHPLP